MKILPWVGLLLCSALYPQGFDNRPQFKQIEYRYRTFKDYRPCNPGEVSLLWGNSRTGSACNPVPYGRTLWAVYMEEFPPPGVNGPKRSRRGFPDPIVQDPKWTERTPDPLPASGGARKPPPCGTTNARLRSIAWNSIPGMVIQNPLFCDPRNSGQTLYDAFLELYHYRDRVVEKALRVIEVAWGVK